MRWEGNRESDNVEDRRGDGGGGGFSIGGGSLSIGGVIIALIASFIFGILAIAVLLRFLRSQSTDIFVVYRVLLAAAVLVVWLG
jgi:predicted metalloprotease